MIHVNKDYNDIPRSLLSPKIDHEIMKLLVTKKMDFSNLGLDSDIRNKLNQLYHGKCAYCETSIERLEIERYRPKSLYYWIAYEWSNLLLVCHSCNMHKANKFPIINEHKRVIIAQTDRNEWKANSNSFLSEEPLLLNPEIDNPIEHLSFFSDGRVFPITERGKITIETLKLNRDYLVFARVKIVDTIISKIHHQLQYTIKIINDKSSNFEIDTILKLAFEPIYKELVDRAKPQSEFSRVGRAILFSFEEFVINKFDDEISKNILKRTHELIKDSISNTIEDILPQTINQKDIKIAKQIKTEKEIKNNIFTINSLYIKNIKCFEDSNILFNNKNTVLLGINGRGKTTVLQLLALAILQIDRPYFESEWKNTKRDNSQVSEFTIEITHNKKIIKLPYEIIENDKIVYKGKKEYLKLLNDIFLIAYGTGRNAEAHDFRLDENFKNIATLFGINSLYFRNGEIADYLKQGNAFLQIKRIITAIFNQAEDIYNRIELSRFDDISKSFLFKIPTNSENEIPLNALSAGFRTSFQWILDFVVRAWKKNYDLDKPETIYGIVLIDEIDTHLHIKWQRTIIHTLQEIFKNVQFIVSTHSPFIVQSFGNQNIISLQLTDDKVNAIIVNIDEGSSYESIIKELFDEKSIFEVNVEKKFDEFYNYLKEIRNNNKSMNDIEFKRIVNELNSKGEEVNTIVSLELRQLKIQTSKKI